MTEKNQEQLSKKESFNDMKKNFKSLMCSITQHTRVIKNDTQKGIISTFKNLKNKVNNIVVKKNNVNADYSSVEVDHENKSVTLKKDNQTEQIIFANTGIIVQVTPNISNEVEKDLINKDNQKEKILQEITKNVKECKKFGSEEEIWKMMALELFSNVLNILEYQNKIDFLDNLNKVLDNLKLVNIQKMINDKTIPEKYVHELKKYINILPGENINSKNALIVNDFLCEILKEAINTYQISFNE